MTAKLGEQLELDNFQMITIFFTNMGQMCSTNFPFIKPYRVLLLGPEGVGKTTLLERLKVSDIENQFLKEISRVCSLEDFALLLRKRELST